MLVDMKVFSFSTCLTTLSTCELVVNDTVGGKDIMKKFTRKVNDKCELVADDTMDGKDN